MCAHMEVCGCGCVHMLMHANACVNLCVFVFMCARVRLYSQGVLTPPQAVYTKCMCVHACVHAHLHA